MSFIRRGFSWILILPVKLYQWILSPLFPDACRYSPTCSEYMIEAIRIHGPFKGLWLGTKRLSRCHPWGGSGEDPVPPKHSGPCRHSSTGTDSTGGGKEV